MITSRSPVRPHRGLSKSTLARRGLHSTLATLVRTGWLTTESALELVPMLMYRNAERLFPVRSPAAVGGAAG